MIGECKVVELCPGPGYRVYPCRRTSARGCSRGTHTSSRRPPPRPRAPRLWLGEVARAVAVGESAQWARAGPRRARIRWRSLALPVLRAEPRRPELWLPGRTEEARTCTAKWTERAIASWGPSRLQRACPALGFQICLENQRQNLQGHRARKTPIARGRRVWTSVDVHASRRRASKSSTLRALGPWSVGGFG
jgi:hypothetical protein